MSLLEPGDLVLVKTNHFVSKLIRFGQRGYGKNAAQWNHVAVYVGDGRIVEALTRGVAGAHLNKYSHRQIIHAEGDLAMRVNAAAFAASCVGQEYGYLTILAIAVKVLTKGKIEFGISGTSICSGLAARALERMGYNWNPYDPRELTPAYLAKTFTKPKLK